MSDLPRITPRTVAQPDGIAWPTSGWMTQPSSLDAAVRAIADRAFDDPGVAETRTVLIVQHGAIVYERYQGSLPSFTGDGGVITADTTQISWSMAKSMLHYLVGTLVVIPHREFDRVADIAQAARLRPPELHAASDLPVVDVQTWNDSFGQHGKKPPDAREETSGGVNN